MKNFKPTHVALALIGLGFLLIIVAWSGASRVACVDCQMPYLLSGGFLGLGFITVGSALLLFEAGRRLLGHLESKLDELNTSIQQIRGSTNGTAPAISVATTKPVAAAKKSPTNGLVVVGRSSFHRPDCRLVEGKDDLDYASKDEAVARGLTPCRVCDPARETARR